MKNPFRQHKLKCPKDYSLAKFHNIRKMFQTLDTNGDMVINHLDLEVFCEQYYKDEIEELKHKIEKSKLSDDKKIRNMYDDTEYLVNDLVEKYYEDNGKRTLKKDQKERCKLLQLRNEFVIIDLNAKGLKRRTDYENYIDLIKSFTTKEKGLKLAEQIRGDNKYRDSITFKKFFKFFKNKKLEHINDVLKAHMEENANHDNFSLLSNNDSTNIEELENQEVEQEEDPVEKSVGEESVEEEKN